MRAQHLGSRLLTMIRQRYEQTLYVLQQKEIHIYKGFRTLYVKCFKNSDSLISRVFVVHLFLKH